jgi:hypothetical protein
MAMIVVGMAWWANASKRNKIYCSFKRVNKTSIHKFVKMTSRYVVFDSKRYDIVTSCVVFDWWDKGLVHMLFPQWVATLDFTYANRWPIDPATGKTVIISPEVRNAMNKEEWVKSYARGFTPPSAKKQTFAQQWLPMLSIGLVALVGVYVFVNNQAFQKDLVNIYNQLNAIAK